MYRLPSRALPLHLVVACELPRTRSTLLVRALGTGRVLREALDDLARLPDDAWERTAALAAVNVLRSKSPPIDEVDDPEERAIIMTNAELYERIKSEGRQEGRLEGRQEGRQEGRLEGQLEAKARAVLSVLSARGFEVSEAQEAMVVGCPDEGTLDRWLLAALTATSVEAALSAASPRPR